MQRLVETWFTLLIGTCGVLAMAACVFHLLIGNMPFMIVAALTAAVCRYFVQRRTPIIVSIIWQESERERHVYENVLPFTRTHLLEN